MTEARAKKHTLVIAVAAPAQRGIKREMKAARCCWNSAGVAGLSVEAFGSGGRTAGRIHAHEYVPLQLPAQPEARKGSLRPVYRP